MEGEGGDGIEEVSATVSGGEEPRWVDGSELDDSSGSTAPSWSVIDGVGDGGEAERGGYGSLRRRLVEKSKRVDSFDADAMEIEGVRSYHSKVVD